MFCLGRKGRRGEGRGGGAYCKISTPFAVRNKKALSRNWWNVKVMRKQPTKALKKKTYSILSPSANMQSVNRRKILTAEKVEKNILLKSLEFWVNMDNKNLHKICNIFRWKRINYETFLFMHSEILLRSFNINFYLSVFLFFVFQFHLFTHDKVQV